MWKAKKVNEMELGGWSEAQQLFCDDRWFSEPKWRLFIFVVLFKIRLHR